jgi:hypothetical protein
MENIPPKKFTIQIIMLILLSFKHTKIQFEEMSTHLGDSIDCDFTHKQMQNLQDKLKHTISLMSKQT